MAEENRLNIGIECGIDFVMPFTWYDENGDPMDLTGATVEAQLREYEASPDFFEFACYHNGAGGRITVTMLHETTAQIPYSYGVYDVHVTLNGIRYRPLYGDVKVYNNVTKVSDGSILFTVSVNTYDDLPSVGNTERLYFVKQTGMFYRWNGTNYVYIGTSNGIASIEKIGSRGDVETGIIDTYRIYYSDGRYDDFELQNGMRGLIGPVGPQGRTGDAATITIRDTITGEPGTPARVINYGNTHEAILDFIIPKGEQGDGAQEVLDLLGDLAFQDEIDYESDQLINKPDFQEELWKMLGNLQKFYPYLPYEINLALYLLDETLYTMSPFSEIDDEEELAIFKNGTGIVFSYDDEEEELIIQLHPVKHVEEAPADGYIYARQNENWVRIN